jgi:hypothetical protein
MKNSLRIFIFFSYISAFVLQNKQESNMVQAIFFTCLSAASGIIIIIIIFILL